LIVKMDVFTSFNRKAMKNPLVKKIIMSALMSDKCRKILPQSNAAKTDLKMALGEKDYDKIKHKVEVLYLAMRACKKEKLKRKDNKFIISFVGREFYNKGGHDLFAAFKILREKYGDKIELKFKGDVPERYRKTKIPGIRFIEGYLSRDKLFDEMYLGVDVFVMPTHTDNYGVVFLEAMSAGIPIIGTTSFTVPELIDDGKNGFLIESPYSWENYIPHGKTIGQLIKDLEKPHPEIVKQLVEKLSILIENKKLCEKMGKKAREIIETGRLSIEKRNENLGRIYKEALRLKN